MIARLRSRLGSDVVLRRLAQNVGYLFSANIAVALIGLVTLAITARALGPAGLGAFALIEAFVRSFNRVFQLESWQAVLRYGAGWLERGQTVEFARLVKLGILVDVAGALFSTILAVLGALYLAPLVGLDAAQSDMAAVAAMMMLTNVSSTPTAVLRLLDRFGLLSRLAVVFALSRLGLSLAAWAFWGTLWSFVAAMMIASAIEGLIPAVVAWRELAKLGYRGILHVPLAGIARENPGILRFTVNANASLIARESTQRFDTLVLGAMLDETAVGLYQIAKRVGVAALRLGRPFQQAVQPEIARLWSRGEFKRFRRLVFTVNAGLGLAAVAAVAAAAPFMEQLTRLFFGDAFGAAALLVTIQACAVAVFLSGLALNPAVLIMGEDRRLVRISLSSTLGFFVILPVFVLGFGAVGASLSHLVFNVYFRARQLSIFRRGTQSAIAAAKAAAG